MKRQSIVSYLKKLRDRICADFEELETEGKKFERKNWQYSKGEGGGEMSVLRGDVFEKAAVNWSGVGGAQFPSAGAQNGAVANEANGKRTQSVDAKLKAQADGPFFATGVSLITHMSNPKAPTVHFNIRYIEVGDRFWFGGGYDLTPMGFEFTEDTKHFHSVAEQTLKPFGSEIYSRFKKNAAEYFYIPHRKRERGVGGIFFDQFNTGDEGADFALWQAVGEGFLDSIMPIYRRRIAEPFNESDRKVQLERRGHYVEFNLLYDRGTKFGFQSGGNPEAILCSMPPLASW